MFQRKAGENENAFLGAVEDHSRRQMNVYQAQTTDALVDESVEAGIRAGVSGNFQEMERQVGEGDQARTLWSQGKGMNAAVVEGMIKKDSSRVYAGTITQMLANKKDQLAKDTFAKYADKMTERDRTHIAGLVSEGSSLGDALRVADKVFTNYVDWETKEEHKVPATFSEAMAEASQLANKMDPKTKKMVEQEVAQRWGLKNAAEKDATDTVFQGASHQLDQKENYGKLANEVIDPVVWNALPQNDRTALLEYSRSILRPMKEGDDSIAVTNWYALSNDDIAQLSPADMLRWRYGDPDKGRPPLSPANYKQFSEQWGKIRKGEDDLSLAIKQDDRKYLFTNAKNGNRLDMGDVKDLDTLGDKTTTQYKERSATFENAFREVNRRMDAAQTEKGKKLKDLDRRKIIDDYLLEQPVKQGFLGRIFGVNESERKIVGAITRNTSVPEAPGYQPKPVDEAKLEVSDTEKQRINQSIKRITGRDGSDALIRRLKAAEVSGASPEDLRKVVLGQ
jgi:hypothetical protein